ncbi:MAG: ribonuclease E/G, partial [Atribacterota bacterium]
MKKDIIIDMSEVEVRAALLENGRVVEFFFERVTESRLAGNIFKGMVENVLPGIQSAFVNTGFDKNAFLFIGDILFDEKGKTKTIEQILKPGQEIIVQVAKEPMGTKGARVTTKITLPGRYVVLMPGMNSVGVSHRISSPEERDKLKKLVEKIKPDNMGVIVRTVAESKSHEEIKEDIESLIRLWNRIQKKLKIPGCNVLVNASHTHPPDRMLCNDREQLERAFEAVLRAFENMTDVKIGYGIGHEDRISINRNLRLKNGRHWTIRHTNPSPPD